MLTKVRESGVRVISLALPEHLESSVFDELNSSILTLIDSEPGGRWLIDLSRVDYMGSTLLGMMVNVRQRVKQAKGRLALCCLSDRLLGIFRACSLINLFVVCKSRSAAVRDVS